MKAIIAITIIIVFIIIIIKFYLVLFDLTTSNRHEMDFICYYYYGKISIPKVINIIPKFINLSKISSIQYNSFNIKAIIK